MVRLANSSGVLNKSNQTHNGGFDRPVFTDGLKTL